MNHPTLLNRVNAAVQLAGGGIGLSILIGCQAGAGAGEGAIGGSTSPVFEVLAVERSESGAWDQSVVIDGLIYPPSRYALEWRQGTSQRQGLSLFVQGDHGRAEVARLAEGGRDGLELTLNLAFFGGAALEVPAMADEVALLGSALLLEIEDYESLEAGRACAIGVHIMGLGLVRPETGGLPEIRFSWLSAPIDHSLAGLVIEADVLSTARRVDWESVLVPIEEAASRGVQMERESSTLGAEWFRLEQAPACLPSGPYSLKSGSSSTQAIASGSFWCGRRMGVDIRRGTKVGRMISVMIDPGVIELQVRETADNQIRQIIDRERRIRLERGHGRDHFAVEQW